MSERVNARTVLNFQQSKSMIISNQHSSGRRGADAPIIAAFKAHAPAHCVQAIRYAADPARMPRSGARTGQARRRARRGAPAGTGRGQAAAGGAWLDVVRGPQPRFQRTKFGAHTMKHAILVARGCRRLLIQVNDWCRLTPDHMLGATISLGATNTEGQNMPFLVWGWILIAQAAAVIYLLKKP